MLNRSMAPIEENLMEAKQKRSGNKPEAKWKQNGSKLEEKWKQSGSKVEEKWQHNESQLEARAKQIRRKAKEKHHWPIYSFCLGICEPMHTILLNFKKSLKGHGYIFFLKCLL